MSGRGGVKRVVLASGGDGVACPESTAPNRHAWDSRRDRRTCGSSRPNGLLESEICDAGLRPRQVTPDASVARSSEAQREMHTRTVDSSLSPTVAVFAPHPLLTVTLEREGADREGVHFDAGGQGVWVARTAAGLGAVPALCSFIGGESGELLRGLLDRLPGERCLVPTTTASGCYVTDRRSGKLEVLSMALSDPPWRGELDGALPRACSEAIACGWSSLPTRCLPTRSRSSSTVTSSPTSAPTAAVRSLTCRPLG